MADTSHPALREVDALTQLSFLVLGTLERRAAEHDLSLIQTRLLGVLRDRRPTMNELAALLQLEKSSVTGLVDRAERRGLVQRVASPTDGRATHVALTRKGRSLAARVGQAYEADVTALLAGLTAPQRRELPSLATRVVVDHAADRGIELFATVAAGADRTVQRGAASPGA